MPSSRLLLLEKQTKELRRLLLPSRFEPTGLYIFPDRVAARTISFRVLAHAEFETYFEDRAVEIAKAAWQAWKRHRYVSSVALHLLGYSGNEMTKPPTTLRAPDVQKAKGWEAREVSIYERLEKCVSEYVHSVTKENHGVKEKNILSIILPIGFDYKKCDDLLLTNLNQLGESRGLVAHSSASYVSQSVDPKDEYGRIKQLIKDLGSMDEEFDRLLQEASV